MTEHNLLLTLTTTFIVCLVFITLAVLVKTLRFRLPPSRNKLFNRICELENRQFEREAEVIEFKEQLRLLDNFIKKNIKK